MISLHGTDICVIASSIKFYLTIISNHCVLPCGAQHGTSRIRPPYCHATFGNFSMFVGVSILTTKR